MKTVKKTKNSLIFVLFCLLAISCKKTTNKSQKNTNLVVDTIVKAYDYSTIETFRGNDGFNWKLIDTLPVKEDDTVLFYKDILGGNSITLTNKSLEFEIKTLGILNYYKTGTNKFSSYEIILKNKKIKNTFNFYAYSNHGPYKNPYNLNNISGLVDVNKVNDTLAMLNVNVNYFSEFTIYFTVENNTVNVVKTFIHDESGDIESFYELDTLITYNKKNRFIDIGKLQDFTERDSNLRKNN